MSTIENDISNDIDISSIIVDLLNTFLTNKVNVGGTLNLDWAMKNAGITIDGFKFKCVSDTFKTISNV